jgi:hypothetical protein
VLETEAKKRSREGLDDKKEQKVMTQDKLEKENSKHPKSLETPPPFPERLAK